MQKEPEGAVLALLVIAAAVLGLVWHGPGPLPTIAAHPAAAVHGPALGPALAAFLHGAAVVVLLVVVLAAALWAARLVATRRTLRTRVRLVAMPSAEVELRPQVVADYCRALADVRRRWLSWFDRPACAIGFRVVPAGPMRGAFVVEVPRALEARAREALSAIPGLTVDRAEALLPEPARGAARARVELVLARPDRVPLARVGVDPDPQARVFARFARLREGEFVSSLLLLEPLSPWRRLRAQRRMMRHASATARRADEYAMGEHVGHMQERAQLQTKLAGRTAPPLFRFQLLLEAEAPTRRAAVGLLEGLLTHYGRWAGQNHLRPVGAPIMGSPWLGPDAVRRRWWADLRLRRGLFRPSGRSLWPHRRNLVTADEVAGMAVPPGPEAGHVLRQGDVRGPAPGVVPYGREADVLPLGRLVRDRSLVAFHPSPFELSTVVVLGQAGSGKSTILARAALHQVRYGGRALAFLDPHRAAVEAVWARLTEEERARAVYLDPQTGRVPVSLNLLDVAGLGPDEIPSRALVLRDTLSSLVKAQAAHRQIREAIGRTVSALLAINGRLAAEDQLTLFSAARWWTDDEWREALVPLLEARQVAYWSRLRAAQRNAAGPLLDLVDSLRSAPGMLAFLGHPRSSWDAGEAMDTGQLVLVALGSGIGAQLLANLLALAYVEAARRRQLREPGDWTEAAFVIDEAPILDRAIAGPLGEGMRETRKFGLSWWLGSQYLSGALSEETVRAVFANRTLLLTAALSADDARLIARNTGELVDAAAVVGLGPHRFLAQVRRSAPFVVESVPLDAEWPLIDGRGPETAGEAPPVPEEAEDRARALLAPGAAPEAARGAPRPAPVVTPAPLVRMCGFRECGRPIDPGRRRDTRFCSDAHRQAEGRARRLEQFRPRVVQDA